MSNLTNKITSAWQDAANLLLGLWLVASPWVLAYSTERLPMTIAVVVGLIIAVAAAAALYAFKQWEEWVNVALASWLVVSPWVLGFNTLQTPTWNHVAVGILVAALALWSTTIEHGGNVASKG